MLVNQRGPEREWQIHRFVQSGSCSSAGQMNREHLKSMSTLWVIEEAVAGAGTAGLSRVSAAEPPQNTLFCWFKAMLVSHSALEKSERAAPLWDIGCRVLPSSGSPARPASTATATGVPVPSAADPRAAWITAPSAARGLQPQWPLWGGAVCHNVLTPTCGSLPSAGDRHISWPASIWVSQHPYWERLCQPSRGKHTPFPCGGQPEGQGPRR